MELVTLAKNPVPSGGSVGFFKGYDGAQLRFARWDATRMPRRGTVCLFGGRTEFIEKYFEVIADLRRRGFAVATMDWRGQGGSQRMLSNPRKGHVRGFWEYDRDLIRFMKDIVLPDCLPPFIGLAHSMGGNVLLRAATMPGLWFERIVLTAPMIAIHDSILGPRPISARAYAEIGCALGHVDRLRVRRLRRAGDRAGRSRATRSPPTTSAGCAPRRCSTARRSSGSARRPSDGCGPRCAPAGASPHPDYPARINVPLLMFAAGNDTVVSTRAIEDFAVGAKVASSILMPGARHEILQENDSRAHALLGGLRRLSRGRHQGRLSAI